MTHLKRPSCWEGLGAEEGDDRGWDDWMTSPTQWTWVWVNSRSLWWTGRPGVLQSMGSQRVWHDWATEVNWTELNQFLKVKELITQSCLTVCNARTVVYQAALSMEFSRKEYWSGLPFPSSGDLPDPGIESKSPALQADPLPSEPPLYLVLINSLLCHYKKNYIMSIICWWFFNGNKIYFVKFFFRNFKEIPFGLCITIFYIRWSSPPLYHNYFIYYMMFCVQLFSKFSPFFKLGFYVVPIYFTIF